MFNKSMVQLNIEKIGEITVKSIYTASSHVNSKINLVSFFNMYFYPILTTFNPLSCAWQYDLYSSSVSR